MALPLTVPPTGRRTFLDLPLQTDLAALDAGFAVIGLPWGMPYRMAEMANDQSKAPAAVRAASDLISEPLEHWDFDFDASLAELGARIVDCGDVPGDPADPAGHYRRAEEAARLILARGAVPLAIGGDHGVPIPLFRAYRDHGPVTLVQIDAHLDWRDQVNGVREGYSSPMRRASEMPWIEGMVQIGLRGTGSARAEEVAAARKYGAVLIGAREVHDTGMAAVLARIPDGRNYHLTIDADGLDPSEMPAVAAPVPGGLTFHQCQALIRGLASKGRLCGMDIVEITPSRDVNENSAVLAGRLMLNAVAAILRGGRGRR